MKESLTLTLLLPVPPDKVYKAWLNSKEHSLMTGGEAKITAAEGKSFTAWDGYISGKNIELIPSKKIVQTWRTTEFDEHDEDSNLEILLEPHAEGCKLTLHHTNIPQGQTQYKSGWLEHYFEPMKEYFRRKDN